MKHFLLFDSDCSLCTGLAAAVERESDGLLIAKSLRDQEMLRILERVRPTWKHESTLLQIQDDKAEAFTGFAMRVHLIAVLGPQRAYRVAKVVQNLVSRQLVSSYRAGSSFHTAAKHSQGLLCLASQVYAIWNQSPHARKPFRPKMTCKRA